MNRTTELLKWCLNLPEVQALASVTENSKWHQEESVLVHTTMVLEEYERQIHTHRAYWPWTYARGAVACIFHDVGKIAGIRQSDGRLTCYNHEAKSAAIFREVVADSSELSLKDKIVIEWLIRHHLPYGTAAHGKLKALARGSMAAGDGVFERVLWADQRGRVTDDRDRKYQAVDDWLTNTLAKGYRSLTDISVDEYPTLKNADVLVPPVGDDEPRVRRKLFVMVGASGSGKTTLVKSLLNDNPRLATLSWDDLRHEFSGESDYNAAFEWFRCNQHEFFEGAYNRFATMVAVAESDVVLDTTNLHDCSQYIDEAIRLNYTIVYLVFDRWTLDTLMDRQQVRRDKTVPEHAVAQQLVALSKWSPYKHDQVLFMR